MAKSARIPNNREKERSAREAHTLNELKTIEILGAGDGVELPIVNLVTGATDRDIVTDRCGNIVYAGSVG